MATLEGGVPKDLPVIKYDKYSGLFKLINITDMLFLAGHKFGCWSDELMINLWGTTDIYVAVKLYFVNCVQNKCFSRELDFLMDPKAKKVPDLVSNFSLFVDPYGIIRSDCRFGEGRAIF